MLEENENKEEKDLEIDQHQSKSDKVEKDNLTQNYNLRPQEQETIPTNSHFFQLTLHLRNGFTKPKNALIDELNLFIKEEVFKVEENPNEA